ncbi:hypothetical protein LCGC14_0643940 [marine sediment metagenome]|uniref:Uncharacterized protein n=1 Tax=marine sediment metagenome TaxID=412755 RepID=A0A0F9QYF6_9ZZZZ
MRNGTEPRLGTEPTTHENKESEGDMSAECQRCGWDLPYDGDCVVCDENGLFSVQLSAERGHLEEAAALAAAGKKTQPKAKVHSATCWSKQMCVPCTKNVLTLAEAETAGLASKLLEVQQEAVDARKERDIAISEATNWADVASTAQAEVAEAQARLRKANCEYGDGWLSDDLECERDVEPWCGKHAVLYYIKENKEAGGRFMITLGEQADRIAELEDNNRILRDGWTADNKKLMDVLGALPAIIFATCYYDLGTHGVTWEIARNRWEKSLVPALLQEHSGDCKNEPQACFRCQSEDVMRLVAIVRKGLERWRITYPQV